MRFAWDAKKAAANLKKHGVSFEEAQTAFDDTLAAYYPDSLNETRFILIGYSERRRLLYVVHGEVELHTIRIISARKGAFAQKLARGRLPAPFKSPRRAGGPGRSPSRFAMFLAAPRFGRCTAKAPRSTFPPLRGGN